MRRTAGLHLAGLASSHLSPPLLDGVWRRGVPSDILVVSRAAGLLGDVAQTEWWGRVVLPHVLHGFRGQTEGIVNPGVEGRIDGELPLQFAVLRRRRLLELTPGTTSWRLQTVIRETSHLQGRDGAGHAGHPQVSLLQPPRILYGL